MATIEQAFRDYRDLKLGPASTGAATARSLAHLLNPLADRPIDSVSEDDIQGILEPIAQSAPVHANRILAYGRSFFAWAFEQGLVSENPAGRVREYASVTTPGRQLSLGEIVLIWRGAGELGFPFSQAFRLLIVTAALREQIGALRVTELSRDRKSGSLVWSPTGLSLSDGSPYSITQPPLAEALVASAMARRRAGSDFIFSRTGRTPIDGWSKAKRNLDAVLASFASTGALDPWRINDLRLSFPVLANEYAGVEPQVAEGCLRRISRFVGPAAKAWMQSAEMSERASDAFAAWADVLTAELDITAIDS